MMSEQQTQMVAPPSSSIFDAKSLIILFLALALVCVFLGINVVNIAENFLRLVDYLVQKLLGIFGYTVGSVLDISGDAVQNVGETIKKKSEGGAAAAEEQNNEQHLRDVLERKTVQDKYPKFAPAAASSSEGNYCLVGVYNGQRGCVLLNPGESCTSGQVYDSHAKCAAP